MTKLEQILDNATKQAIEADVYYQEDCKVIPLEDVLPLITEVWNEAIKECEGCVPGELPEVTLQDPYALERNIAHNSCRNQTLQAISKLKV